MKRLVAIALAATALPLLPALPARSQAQFIPAAVGACTANPMVCAVVVTSAGWILYWRHHPPLFCTAGGCRASKHLQDPEAREESDSVYVWAADDAQARRMCQRVADTYGGRMDRVVPATVKELRNNWGKRKYTCHFTRFVGGR